MGKASKSPPAKPAATPNTDVNLYGKLLQLAELARPYVLVCINLLMVIRAKVAPFASDEELAKLAAGLIVTFFGARFMATIAAFEAFRMCGWRTSKRAALKLYENYRKAVEASSKDDAIDADSDGVPDVTQLPLEELVRRKMPIVLKSIDPESVSEALSSLYAGAAAVIATLRVRFAATLTLGATLGDVAADFLKEHAAALAASLLPAEHAKFVPLLVHYGLRMAGVSVAFLLQRFAAAAHSALRGSQLLAESLLAIAVRSGYLHAAHTEEPQLRTALQLGLAALGAISQYRNGFGVPFPLSIVLLPLSAFEAILLTAVGV